MGTKLAGFTGPLHTWPSPVPGEGECSWRGCVYEVFSRQSFGGQREPSGPDSSLTHQLFRKRCRCLRNSQASAAPRPPGGRGVEQSSGKGACARAGLPQTPYGPAPPWLCAAVPLR